MSFNGGKRYCPDCGQEMKLLATSYYCRNDCDRIPKTIDIELEKTGPIKISCPDCKSTDCVPVSHWGWYGMRCMDCLKYF